MVNVVSPRCQAPGCTTYPIFNIEGEAKGIFCKAHAAPGMVNVVSPRCQAPGCTMRPNFNFEGETKGIFCKAHASPGMVCIPYVRRRQRPTTA
ncbi:hypothetical protein MNEG_12039 [Monoraphidium neglectum]|uniref:Uncharacterized protein n=1 Tax=Monoraphidium neglectum TaxID=145388 RepID=A0A0D2M3I9_9CHLO|nr:hypothetical protein MNEG_12039 [Monoraphidium neglectum]KIY95921.1 hypothetical protein MNEG_12039 [Monoraphidium neglectum]|eukprot:XP_013894941.1 hypothetical protein MNEG_12039 [Monoraphidium neglectum]